MANLFREKSLERLNDHERLDQIFHIVSPLNWVILTVTGALLIITVIWGFFGTITTRVSGNGIFISHGQQIYDAVAQAEGRVDTVLVNNADNVKKGQILVTLHLPILEIELQNKKQFHETLKGQLEIFKAFVRKKSYLEAQHLRILQQNWKIDLENANKSVQFLNEAIEIREKLVSKGSISKQEMADLKSRYYKELEGRDAISNKMEEKKIESERLIEQDNDRLQQLNNKFLQSAHEIAALQGKLEVSSLVKSPIDGTVTELIAKPGAIVRSGDVLVDIEGSAEVMDAVVYVPAIVGTMIKHGMTAYVVPSIVKKQEYGSIVGTVARRDLFPSSEAGMMSILANRELVKEFNKSGPQLFVRVDLLAAETPSGYKWTSSEGPDMGINSGTLCTAEVTVKTQAPITLIIPALKKLIGIE